MRLSIFFLLLSLLLPTGLRADDSSAKAAPPSAKKSVANENKGETAKAEEDKSMAPDEEPVEWVRMSPAEEREAHKRRKQLDFAEPTIEGVDRRHFDAFNEFADNQDMDGASKSHYYGMRSSFKDEIDLTLSEL